MFAGNKEIVVTSWGTASVFECVTCNFMGGGFCVIFGRWVLCDFWIVNLLELNVVLLCCSQRCRRCGFGS